MRIYQTPGNDPDQGTLLATRETWEALTAQMGRTSAAKKAIDAAMTRTPEGEPVRVSLSGEDAASVLRLAATLG